MKTWLACFVIAAILTDVGAFFFSNPFKSVPTDFDSWVEQELNRNETVENLPKYFHEAGKGPVPGHYDGRFQHGMVSYEARQDTQIHMVRAYLEFCRAHNLETWLAHGTLLGWWWNAERLPWDSDLDVQISDLSLFYLAKHFNNTSYDYSSEHSDRLIDPPIKRSYLLDVNPAYAERGHGNGNNIIDARWVDMRNGLYIDITAVSETRPDIAPGIWSCKNLHSYKTTDLYPMRETLFEGVIAKVPYEYVKILTKEYKEKALIMTEFEGHQWDPETRKWIKKNLDDTRKERIALYEERRKKVADKITMQKAKQAAKAFNLFGASDEKKKADADEKYGLPSTSASRSRSRLRIRNRATD